jgi:DNA-binding transcriptional LysR family regulator
MVEQTIAGHQHTFSVRPNRLGGCYNNSMALREAVLANIGIGTSPIWAFSDELENQSVKVILKEYEPSPIPIQVVYRRGRFQSAKVKCFIDFLIDEFKLGLSWQPTSLLE